MVCYRIDGVSKRASKVTIMSVELSPIKHQLIDRVAADEGLGECTKDIRAGSVKGDNYLGIIHTVALRSKHGDGQLQLILKSAMPSAELRKQAPVRKAYEREIFMYGTIFDAFRAFQQRHKVVGGFCETVRCYGSTLHEGEECLLLENVRTKGFRLWDRQQPMDGTHVGLVLATYGKFHALSIAMKHLQPQAFEGFAPNLDDIFDTAEAEQKMSEASEQMFKNTFEIIAGNEKAIGGLRKFSGVVKEYFEKYGKMSADEHSVILHGDCWCNNMMFKYDQENVPRNVRLIDWQISRIGSPVFDLAYFFYVCGSREVIDGWEGFLRLYYDSFSSMLKQFGCNPEELFPYRVLEQHWRLHCKYGLFMAMMVLKVMVSESEETPDFSQIADTGENIMKGFINHSPKNMNKYRQRLCDVIESMVDNKLL